MNISNGPRDSAQLRVLVQSGESLLTDRAEDWDRLSGGVPFRQTMWLRPLWTQFGQSQRSCFLTVWDNEDRLRGILPLERFGSRAWQTIGSLPCTDHVSMLCQELDRQNVAAAIADFLVTHVHDPKHGWDRLHFGGVLAGDPGMSALIDELDHRRVSIRIESRMNVWFRSSTETWDQFLQSRSRKYRHRLRFLVRQFESVDDLLRVQFPADEDELTIYLDELIRLHQNHWQAMGEPGSYAADGMIPFIHDAALTAFRQNRLFLPVLIRTDPITGHESVLAAQIHFIGEDGRLYCYSSGVNYEHGERTPGNLLNAYLLRHAHENNLSGIDFMRGDEDYKSRIYAEPTPLLKLNAFAPTPVGWLKLAALDTYIGAKQTYRHLRKRPLSTTYSIEEGFDVKFQTGLPRHVDPIDKTRHDAPSVILTIHG